MTGLAVGRGGLPFSRALSVELMLFCALATFATAQWARLVASPPVDRVVLVLAVVTAGAAALGAVRASGLGSFPARCLAAAVAVATTAAAAVAIGLPARLLAPGNWPELVEGLGLGLAGIEDTEMPYGGEDAWLRLTLLLGAPLLLGLAAALAFWPGRRLGRQRILALVALVAIYAVAVTLDSPDAELLWGVGLLVLVVAWLWIPGLGTRRAARVATAAFLAGVAALPVAAALDVQEPWWDYESWDWFGRDRSVSFEWEHTYGPLDWPREGTTLLEVRSDQPLYWKTAVLDRFDGFTWTRAFRGDPNARAELAGQRQPLGERLPDRHPEWVSEATFDLRGLRTGLVVGAGTTLAVDGVENATPAPDGTTPLAPDALESGAEYSVSVYAPRPSAAQMRRAPDRYRLRAEPSTAVGLSLSDSVVPGVAPPLWGEPRPGLGAILRETSYGGMYRLARRLTAGAPTVYDAVRRIETHLREGYEYSPVVPEHGHALPSFLFEDRRGYCQQFSGSMALMLRMVGIPSRVATGFAPGSYDADRGLYEIRDFDAHSWVEVYFRGIGWVPFDPTPAAAPAASQVLNPSAAPGFVRAGPGLAQGDPAELGRRGSVGDSGAQGSGADGGGPWAAVAGATGAAALAGALGLGVVFDRRRRRLAAGEAGDDQIRELAQALGRLGWRIENGTTLRGLERRFAGVGRRGIARYAEALRWCRYAGDDSPPPGPRERRAMRHALAAGGGLRRRWRILLAVPPGGPRPGSRDGGD